MITWQPQTGARVIHCQQHFQPHFLHPPPNLSRHTQTVAEQQQQQRQSDAEESALCLNSRETEIITFPWNSHIVNVVFPHNFADNWIQYPRGIISPHKNTKPSKQTGRNPKKFVSVSTYYICAIRRLIWMCSMSVGIMPDWLTRPKTKIIA